MHWSCGTSGRQLWIQNSFLCSYMKFTGMHTTTSYVQLYRLSMGDNCSSGPVSASKSIIFERRKMGWAKHGPVSMLKKEALGAWEKRYRSVRWANLHGNSKRKMGGWRKGWQRGSRQLGFKGEQACYWVVAAWYVILWLVALSSHSGCHWVP